MKLKYDGETQYHDARLSKFKQDQPKKSEDLRNGFKWQWKKLERLTRITNLQ